MALASIHPGRIRRELDPARLDALHFPLTLAIPRGTGVPAATSILDLQHELFPQFFSRAERAYRRVAYRAAVRESRLVIAISEHVKETIVERLGVPPERVRAIHLGIDLERLRPGEEPREPFLLYPANGWPHKNHRRLLEAFALLRRERPELRLVLTGSGLERLPATGRRRDPRARARRRAPRASTGRPARSSSPASTRGSACRRSRRWPPAVRSRRPTRARCPRCWATRAALLRPDRPGGDRGRRPAVLADPRPFAERGLVRARKFTWDACARRHDDVYEELSAA